MYSRSIANQTPSTHCWNPLCRPSLYVYGLRTVCRELLLRLCLRYGNQSDYIQSLLGASSCPVNWAVTPFSADIFLSYPFQMETLCEKVRSWRPADFFFFNSCDFLDVNKANYPDHCSPSTNPKPTPPPSGILRPLGMKFTITLIRIPYQKEAGYIDLSNQDYYPYNPGTRGYVSVS